MDENKDNVIPVSDAVKKKNGRSIKIIGITALILILLMVIAAYTAEKTGLSPGACGKDSGYIVCPVLPDNIRDLKPVSSGVVALTSTSVDYIDSYGRKLASNTHLYAQPVIKTNKSSVLLYNKGGDSFRIERNGEIYNTYKVPGTLTFAGLGKKNNYIYVLNDNSGYQSHLYVYSFQGKKQFEWGSSSEYLVTAALSPNGRSIAVGLIGVKNGEYYSHILMFDFKSENPVFSVEFPDTTVCELFFEGRNKIISVTDNGVYKIDKNGNQTSEIVYSNKELYHTFISDGMSAVAIAKYGDINNTCLYLFDKKFNSFAQREYKSEITMISGTSDRIAVAFDDKAEIIDRNNEKTANISIGEDIFLSSVSENKLYVLTLSGLYILPMNHDIETSAESSSYENITSDVQESVENNTETNEENLSGENNLG